MWKRILAMLFVAQWLGGVDARVRCCRRARPAAEDSAPKRSRISAEAEAESRRRAVAEEVSKIRASLEGMVELSESDVDAAVQLVEKRLHERVEKGGNTRWDASDQEAVADLIDKRDRQQLAPAPAPPVLESNNTPGQQQQLAPAPAPGCSGYPCRTIAFLLGPVVCFFANSSANLF